MLSCIVILLICSGVGRLVLRAVESKCASGPYGLLFGAAFGMGILSYTVLVLGLVGLLYPLAVVAVLLVLALLSLRDIGETVSDSRAALSRLPRPSLLGSLVGLPLAAIGVSALIGSLAPPSVNDWDSLAYHLAIPRLYIKWHAIRYIAFSSHSNLPFLTEMLYAVGLMFPALGEAALAKLFHLATGVLATAAIYAMGKKHFSPRAGIIGAVVFASIPLVGWEATTAYIDLATAMYLLLAVFALLSHRDEGGRWGIVAAILLGLAAATKTTALMFIPMGAVWLIYNCVKRERGIGGAVLSALGFGLLAALIASPWYIKSWVQTGNPVYPFLYDTFGGRNWNAQLAEYYRVSQLKFGMGYDFYSLMLLPWNLTMFPWRFFDSRVAFASIGPVFLAALPMFPGVRFGREKMRALLLFTAAGVIIWFFMTQQSRYLIPILAIGAVAVGALFEELRDLRLARVVLVAAIAVGAAWGMLINGVLAVKALPGLVDRHAYLSETMDIYPACQYINSELPRDAKVVFFGDTRGFYCDREYLWGDWIHNTLIPYDTLHNGKDLAAALRRMGVTHALANFGNPSMRQAGLPKPTQLVYEAVEEGLFRPMFQADDGPASRVVVYEVE